MSEKEINLNAPIPTQPIKTPDGQPSSEIIDMGKHKAHLQSQTTGVSAAELVDLILSKNQDELLPWEKVTLPSLGLYYNGRMPNGVIEVRPMGLFADKIFATARLTQTNQALDKVFEMCVKFPDSTFDPLDLLTGDRLFLLFYLRGITHGNIYEFSITCPVETCKQFSTHEYDLNRIGDSIKRPTFPSQPFKIILPYLSDITNREFWVEARYMTGRDGQIIAQQQKFLNKAVGNSVRNADGKEVSGKAISIDQSIEQNMNLLISNVMGVTDRGKIQQFVSKLHSRDAATIREIVRDTAPGVNFEVNISCPECNHEMKIELPITESFFRPKNSGTIRR